MVKIEMTVYEKWDLIRYLKTIQEHLVKECKSGKVTPKYLEMELKSTDNLISRLEGKNKITDYQDTTSETAREKITIDPSKSYYK